jgi:hypothetical protein
MKKMLVMAMMMVMTISANAMSYTAAKNEALFLSDKMAYELNLTDAQYDAVYEINLDYLMSVNGAGDVFGTWWNRRNADLHYVLTAWQYDKYAALGYFYRPLSWERGSWVFNIYSHYTNRSHFYKARPTVFISYKGGNNRKAGHFYADRRVVKPAPKAPAARPANNGSTWRVTNAGNAHRNATTVRTNGHSRSATSGDALLAKNGNRQMAMNTNRNGSGNSHFGGRR